MKTLWISAFFWLVALSFVVPAQAGPLDIADDFMGDRARGRSELRFSRGGRASLFSNAAKCRNAAPSIESIAVIGGQQSELHGRSTQRS